MPNSRRKIRVAVIYGGQSGEHEVSVQTAASVLAALNPRRYEILPVLVDREGRWSVETALLPAARHGRPPVSGPRALLPNGGTVALSLPNGRQAERIDFVLPLIHGTGGEDGCLQGLLELTGLPYAGSGVLGSALGMDKIAQKMVLAQAGLPLVAYRHFTDADWTGERSRIIAEIEEALGYPCFVKPANLGSSVGISKAHHRRELLAGVVDALRYDRRIIVERAVPQAREIECGVLGNDRARVSVFGEIRPSNEFYDYDAKYLSGKSAMEIPADLPAETCREMAEMARNAFRALDCAGMARVDFLVARATNDIYLNEVNTVPGFTRHSMFPRLWEASGLPYAGLLDELIAAGLERHRTRASLQRIYETAAQAAATRKTSRVRRKAPRRS